MKSAIIIGSTGMVGAQVLELLLCSGQFTQVCSLVRRKSGISHPKLKELVVDFDSIEQWKNEINGDVLYSCMGTTLAQAKTKENQYKIDYTYQFKVAEIAALNNVNEYVLISSAGANMNSKNFYLQMKGQLDNDILNLNFKKTFIFRPGQLYGNRKENRIAEKIGLKAMFTLNKIGLLKKLKPIHSKELAQAMLNALDKSESQIFTLNEIFKLI